MGARVAGAAQAAVPLLIYLAIWQALPMLGIVDPAFLPTPVAVARAFVDLAHSWSFFDDLGMTLLRTFGGLVCGAAIGIPLGAMMALSPAVDGFFDPIVKITYSLPKTALVPLLILWLGIGSATNIVAVVLSSTLPLVVYTYHGVHGAPRILVWSARAMGTSGRGVLRHVLLPAALPDVLTGVRIAIGFALVIAIASEMIASKVGIGKLVFQYGENGAYDYMFAAVGALVAVSCLIDRAVVAFTDHVLRWQDSGLRGEAA